MSIERDEQGVRAALLAAVPPLRDPADRVAEVGGRIRRRRSRTAVGAAALAVVALLAGAGAVRLTAYEDAAPAPVTVPGAEDCAAAGTDQPPGGADAGSDLVPAGAVRVTLCETLTDPPAGNVVGQEPPPRPLATGVEEFAAGLNRLPAVAPNGGCAWPILPGTKLSFVFVYPDRRVVTVKVDRVCGTLATSTQGRRYQLYEQSSPLTTFVRLYRAQLAAQTRPAAIATPACPHTAEMGVAHGTTSPPDGIGRNRDTREAFLPEPLVAVSACRYLLAGDSWALDHQVRRRDDLDSLRQDLNDTWERRGGVACRYDDPGAYRPTLADSLWVADTTGAVSEVRIWRQPCAAVHAGGSQMRPSAALLAAVDGLLGPPS